MLEAGAAAGAGWDLMVFCGIQELLLQPPIEMLEVLCLRRGLVVQFILPEVVVALCGPLPCLTPLQSGCVVVVVVIMMVSAVGSAVHLAFVMLVAMVHAVAVAVLVRVTVVMVDGVVKIVVVVAALIAHGLLGEKWGSLTLRRGAVLPHLIDKEDFGHVVNDEHLSPVRDWLGLSTTEMNVHDEDGERGGGCDHGHGGDIVFPLGRKQRKRSYEGKWLTSNARIEALTCKIHG